MNDWLKAAWNGPFYIGRLQSPVSVGDVLMKVLETLWRGAILCVAAIALFVVGVLVVAEKDKRASARAVSNTPISISIDTDACPRAAPLLVSVENRSARRIESVAYRVDMIDRATGDNLTPLHLMRVEGGGIMPRSARTECLSPYVDRYGQETGFRAAAVDLTATATFVRYDDR